MLNSMRKAVTELICQKTLAYLPNPCGSLWTSYRGAGYRVSGKAKRRMEQIQPRYQHIIMSIKWQDDLDRALGGIRLARTSAAAGRRIGKHEENFHTKRRLHWQTQGWQQATIRTPLPCTPFLPSCGEKG